MEIINIHQAKTQLSKLLQRVQQGEKIVIGKTGLPIARLVPYSETQDSRRGGQWKGRCGLANTSTSYRWRSRRRVEEIDPDSDSRRVRAFVVVG